MKMKREGWVFALKCASLGILRAIVLEVSIFAVAVGKTLGEKLQWLVSVGRLMGFLGFMERICLFRTA